MDAPPVQEGATLLGHTRRVVGTLDHHTRPEIRDRPILPTLPRRPGRGHVIPLVPGGLAKTTPPEMGCHARKDVVVRPVRARPSVRQDAFPGAARDRGLAPPARDADVEPRVTPKETTVGRPTPTLGRRKVDAALARAVLSPATEVFPRRRGVTFLGAPDIGAEDATLDETPAGPVSVMGVARPVGPPVVVPVVVPRLAQTRRLLETTRVPPTVGPSAVVTSRRADTRADGQDSPPEGHGGVRGRPTVGRLIPPCPRHAVVADTPRLGQVGQVEAGAGRPS